MFIDTHAHVNFSGFKEDAEEVIQRALDAGVSVVNVGTQIDTSREAVAMAEKFAELTPPSPLFRKEGEENAMQVITPSNSPSARGRMTAGVYAVIGIHPVHTYSQDLVEEETHFKTREEKFDHEVYLQLGKNPLKNRRLRLAIQPHDDGGRAVHSMGLSGGGGKEDSRFDRVPLQ